jgi:hypothetical protein
MIRLPHARPLLGTLVETAIGRGANQAHALVRKPFLSIAGRRLYDFDHNQMPHVHEHIHLELRHA